MAKKKSKTQKIKKNLKRKQNKAMGNITKEKSNIIKVDKEQKEKIKKETKNKEKKNTKKENEDLLKTKELLKQEIKSEMKEKVKDAVSTIDKPKKIVSSESLDDITSPFIDNNKPKKKKSYLELVFSRIKENLKEQKKKNNKRKANNKVKQKEIIELPKLKSNNDKVKKNSKIIKDKQPNKNAKKEKIISITKNKNSTNTKNIFVRLLICLKNNGHIIFNSVGIVIYIIMIVGLVRIDVFKISTIVYISCIVGFLLFVAISFNKWISGKIFTILISVGMIMAIYHMQYTYDFIRNLNSGVYEYKTYYVVTFDNGVNKSIYNINSKRVGLLKDNCTNIERKLDTKIEPVYVEYDDINKLFEDFYNQEFRAILVNENQYKYMKNNIQNNRTVKILYEFKANAKK